MALDGRKVRANGSKHKAMSYGRMEKKDRGLEEGIARPMAEAVDAEEDARYGKGKRGDELPKYLRFKHLRLKKIQEAMGTMEQEAEAEAGERREEIRHQQEAKQKDGQNRKGRMPKEPSGKLHSKAQRKFANSDFRIIKEATTGSFEQCYDCQAAVDERAQVIASDTVTQKPEDKQQIKPVLEN